MDKKIQQKIIETITMIPGLIGLANLNAKASSKALAEKDFSKGYDVLENKTGLDISLAVIVNGDVRTKVVVGDLKTTLIGTLKKENIKLNKLNVLIKGVK